MINGKKIIVVIPAHNERGVIGDLVGRVPKETADLVLVIDDASEDSTADEARDAGAEVISHKVRKGCGPSIRTGIDRAISGGFDIIVVMAGNGKDDPRQIPLLIDPVVHGGYDLVQGSRYLRGGAWKNMPLHRIIGTHAYSLLFSLLACHRVTDGTNGFRAIRASLFQDKRINIWQDWLNNYEVESYLYYKSVILGYRCKEVPVSKVYPQDLKKGYTQMKPFSGWWSHFRPILLLRFGIRS